MRSSHSRSQLRTNWARDVERRGEVAKKRRGQHQVFFFGQKFPSNHFFFCSSGRVWHLAMGKGRALRNQNWGRGAPTKKLFSTELWEFFFSFVSIAFSSFFFLLSLFIFVFLFFFFFFPEHQSILAGLIPNVGGRDGRKPAGNLDELVAALRVAYKGRDRREMVVAWRNRCRDSCNEGRKVGTIFGSVAESREIKAFETSVSFSRMLRPPVIGILGRKPFSCSLATPGPHVSAPHATPVRWL